MTAAGGGEQGRRQTVVVSGASAGVGRATAIAFGRQGARVGLLARGRDGLAGARREVEAAGGEALPILTDVADADQVEYSASKVEHRFGPIDVWVNSAMVTIYAPVKRITPAEFRRATEVTYLGTVHGTMAALRRMLPRDQGTIVQVGSALAYRAIPLQSAYCGAKFAIRGFTDALRCELLHDGSNVHLTMVQLAAFNTPQFEWARNKMPNRPRPVPPVFQPEVAADAIVWASEHRRRELWVGFPSVKAILGNKIAPELLDRYLAATAYDGQQTEEPDVPGRPDNLFSPMAGDYGVRGRFGAESQDHSAEVWLSTHRAASAGLALGGLGLLAGGILGVTSRNAAAHRRLRADRRHALRGAGR